MAKVQMKQGILWENIPAAKVDVVISKEYMKARLAEICGDLRDLAAEEEVQFQDLQVTAAHLLLDFAQIIQLSKEEIKEIFGREVVALLDADHEIK